MSEHPASWELTRFIRGALDRRRRSRVVRHLLRGCVACKDTILSLGGSDWDFSNEEPVTIPRDLDRAVDRACRNWVKAEERIAQERERAAPLVAEIVAGRRDWLHLNDREKKLLEGVPRVDLWIAVARERHHDDPCSVVEAATLACAAADVLHRELYGRRFVCNLRGLAFAELADAYRLAGDFEAAEEGLRKACNQRDGGTGDLRLQARIHQVAASLACDQRWFAEAYLQIDSAHRLYEQLNDHHLAGLALVKKSHFAACKGDPEEALRFLKEGSTKVNPERDHELPKIILHNRILYLTDAGDHKTAQRLLFEARGRRALPTGEVNKAKLRHVEGRIFLGLGKLDRAAKELELATQELQALNRPLAAGIAGLYLAIVWLEQGKPEKVLPLAESLVQTFRARGVRREALAAMMLLEQACREQRLTIEVVERLQEYLREIERNPRGVIAMPRG